MPNGSRRDFCTQLGLGLTLSRALGAAPPPTITLDTVRSAPSRLSASDASALKLTRSWNGNLCRPALTNAGSAPERVREVVLFSIDHSLPLETGLYGESFQMLSQTAGTLGQPIDLGMSERRHYRIPQPEGALALTGLLALSPPSQPVAVFAFTSCRRFAGRFYLRPGSVDIVIDTENLSIEPGETWPLEEFTFLDGPSLPALLDRLAARIVENHPTKLFPAPPAGWCSWYCFGPRVTARDVRDNLDAIAAHMPALRYVQLDDGYQRAMGDWLETGDAFGGGILSLLQDIRRRGFEPAIWVAPFIAEAGSHLFQNHPDWFVRDDAGRPLSSDRVSFGGWRRGPWYSLDGTHPDARLHLESVFRTMRRDWGCTYFKLDANFWGAIHGGHFQDSNATRVQAYRLGMEAVRRGAGDAFLLGCNHPVWPSFGLIDGSRSSNDISRKWPTIRSVARQGLARNWQNGRLWWNDPDAVVLTGPLTEDEIRFHATAVYASGGLILSGDDLSKLSASRFAMLAKLLPPAAHAAAFDDLSLRSGAVDPPGTRMACLFNWDDAPSTITLRFDRPAEISDFWTGQSLGRHQGEFTVRDMPPHSARILACRAPALTFDVAAFDRRRVLDAAARYLHDPPVTVTAASSPRSAGGPHDFFSEGDYWWPDPADPQAPYVRRDGMSNPANFNSHREFLMRFSVRMPTLAAAWKLTSDLRYARQAAAHARAWFLDPATRMNPSLEFAQAIHGRVTGRGTGIIDTIHLVEVVQALRVIEPSGALSPVDMRGIRTWFADYLTWMETSPHGIAEREAKNNHGTCWVMQAACFARFTGNVTATGYCAERFRSLILPSQMALDGSFPLELRRTKPYGYSLFNLEALAAICRILSTSHDSLWEFQLNDSRSLRRGVDYMLPFIADKRRWPLPPDVMYFDDWPMRQSSLLFAAEAYGDQRYLEVWKKLPPDSSVGEVIRNFFIRQPVLWEGELS